MRLYDVKPKKEVFQWGEMDVISLGESGRARMRGLIPFHAEYEEESADYAIGQTKMGRPKVIRNGEVSAGWIAVLSGKGVYTRGTYGTVYVLAEDAEKVKVHVRGRGAFGAAGGVGSWNEFLVEVKPEYPVRFNVRPAGGRHKIPRKWVVFNGEGDPVVVYAGEEDVYTDQTGIELVDDLVDLVDLIE